VFSFVLLRRILADLARARSLAGDAERGGHKRPLIDFLAALFG
jgi:hypothetical protein